MKRFTCLLLGLCAAASLHAKALTPIGHYLVGAKTGMITLPGTSLGHEYWPIQFNQFTLNSGYAKNITTTSTEGGGGDLFTLSVVNSGSQSFYVYLQGKSNPSFQGACLVGGSESSSYNTLCVLPGTVQAPVSYPYSLYVAQNHFNNAAGYAAARPLQCTSTAPALVQVGGNDVATIQAPETYSLVVDGDTCVINRV